MAEIITKKGNKILVDEKFFEELSKYTWYVDTLGYAITTIYVMSRKESRETGLSRKKSIKMHRLIYELKNNVKLGFKEHIDHINQNKTDNRISNLRLCEIDTSTNQINVGLRQDNTSGYKGVTLRNKTNKYEASISYRGKSIWIGAYTNKEMAAIKYNEKALELFGDTCYLNKINVNIYGIKNNI
jgi:hypothetical protein